jgi:hypothetical protein
MKIFAATKVLRELPFTMLNLPLTPKPVPLQTNFIDEKADILKIK